MIKVLKTQLLKPEQIKFNNFHPNSKIVVIQWFVVDLEWVNHALRKISRFGIHLNFIRNQWIKYMI